MHPFSIPLRTAPSAADPSLTRNTTLLDTTQRLAHIGGYEYDPQSHSMVWTDELYRIHGVPLETRVDQALIDQLYPADTWVQLCQAIERLIMDGTPYNLELPARTLDGRQIWVRTLAAVEPDGTRLRYIGAVQDITAQKETEQALANQLRFQSAVAECAKALLRPHVALNERDDLLADVLEAFRVRSGIAHIGLQHFFQADNTWFYRSVIQVPDRTVGYPITPVSEIRPEYWDTLQHQVHQNQIYSGPAHLLLRENSPNKIYFERRGITRIDGFRVLVNNRLWGVVAFGIPGPYRPAEPEELALLGTLAEMIGTFLGNLERHTLIERQQASEELANARDAAESAVRARTAFLATMSHEIRTPLNAMIGMADLLLHTELSVEQRTFARTIVTGGQTLLAIINNILDFTRIESGCLELESQPFDLHAFLSDTLDLVTHQAHLKGLDICQQIDPSLPQVVIGDFGRLRQILLNLLANAIKFTESGIITLNASATPQKGIQTIVTISVRDTGIGIDPRRIKHMFDPFVQADSSTARRYGGTGLGLAITQQIIGLMQGEIRVASIPGIGSTFQVQIPLQVATRDMLPVAFTPTIPLESPLNVLVVEDNPINQEVTRQLIQRLGHRVTVVGDGRAAIDAVVQVAYDVVLMDIQMPELDGEEAAYQIRRYQDAIYQPYIIALTAHALPGDRERFLQAGMDDYLSKPIDTTDLRRVLARGATPNEHPAATTMDKVAPDGEQKLLFDKTILSRLNQSLGLAGPSTIDTLVCLFEQNIPAQLDALDAAIEQRNSVQVQREAHQLLSACLQIGAQAMAELCRQLEQASDTLGQRMLAAELRGCYPQTLEAIREIHHPHAV